MTNTTKSTENKTQNADSKTPPVATTPVVQTPPTSVVAESVKETAPTSEPVKSEPVAESPVVLTREFFALLGTTVSNAETRVKSVKIAGVNGYSSVNQSDAVAIVRGAKSIVVRKFTPNKEIKDSDGNITQESETLASGELTESGKDRKETIKQYMEWYYNPPVAPVGDPNGFEDSEEKTLVENGAILNAVNMIYKATVGGGIADTLCGIFILQTIAGWEESNWLSFESVLRTVEIDGVSFAGANLFDLIAGADMRYALIDSTFGFNTVSEVAAKEDGTPRKRNRSAVASMINSAEKSNNASQSANKIKSDNAPTGQVYDPASNLNKAREIANAVNGTPSAPALIKSEGEHNGVKIESTPAVEPNASETKTADPVVPVETVKSDPVVSNESEKKTEESKESTPAK